MKHENLFAYIWQPVSAGNREVGNISILCHTTHFKEVLQTLLLSSKFTIRHYDVK